MRNALLAMLAAMLVLAPTAALAQADPAEAAGLTCSPVQAPVNSTVECVVRGLAPASQVSYSVSLSGDVLAEETATAATDGRAAFRFLTGSATGPYLATVTGTAADDAPFSAEVAGTVVAAAPAPAGAVAAGFGPGPWTTAVIALLLLTGAALLTYAVRPSALRVQR